FFFFQAEDGIRDRNVTGVQTCALPIFTEQVRQRVRERVLVLDKQNTSHVVSFLCSLPSVRSWGEPPCLRDEPSSPARSASLAARSSPLPTSPPSSLSSPEGALSSASPVPSPSPGASASPDPSGAPALPAEAVPEISAECSMRTPCGAASLASWSDEVPASGSTMVNVEP